MIYEKEVLMEDKNGLQALINQSIKVLKVVYILLIILAFLCGIMLIITIINTIITLPSFFTMIGK